MLLLQVNLMLLPAFNVESP